MTAAKKKPEPPKHKETPRDYEALVTPIFDKAMGRRLRIARMRKLVDQRELGACLGVSQSVISDLELGRVQTSTFSLADLRDLFGPATNYIMTGAGADNFETSNVARDYWKARLKTCGAQKKYEPKP